MCPKTLQFLQTFHSDTNNKGNRRQGGAETWSSLDTAGCTGWFTLHHPNLTLSQLFGSVGVGRSTVSLHAAVVLNPGGFYCHLPEREHFDWFAASQEKQHQAGETQQKLLTNKDWWILVVAQHREHAPVSPGSGQLMLKHCQQTQPVSYLHFSITTSTKRLVCSWTKEGERLQTMHPKHFLSFTGSRRPSQHYFLFLTVLLFN